MRTAFFRSFNWLHPQSRLMHLLHDKAFINNQWVTSLTNQTFEITNPYNATVIGTAPDMDCQDTVLAIQAAYDSYQIWRHTTGKERGFYLRKWYDLMVKNQNSLSTIVLNEAGKPIREAKSEVRYGNSFIEYYSEEAKRIHGEIISSPYPDKKLFVERLPIGVVGLITPWNFPFALVARKAGAALAAGCTCVIKPAEDTPFSALALMELAQEAGFPDGIINVVTSSRKNSPEIGKLLCESPLVAGISFTGSTKTGKLLFKECSSGIKRVSLELGGDAPFIVYSSANLNKAIKAAITSKFRSSGQTCIASNRFFIQEEKYDEFSAKLLENVRTLKMGDLHNNDVAMGPLINKTQLKKVEYLVEDAISKGAKVLTGAKTAPEYGPLFYHPTVLGEVTPEMQIYKEEVFGPVINLLRFCSEEESIKMANDTLTGLAGYIFTEDVAQIFRISKMLEVGMCGVNEGLISMAEIPFGGIKESGVGREGSHYGIDDFTYVKYICIGNL